VADEFAIIRDVFAARATAAADGLLLGIGDDAALIQADTPLAVTTDTLVSGVHFPKDSDPETIGHKALAVNLSDLAAMAAEARWFTLALTLPQADRVWIEAFAKGLFTLAEAHGIQLIGGDTTQGPLSISITALGSIPAGMAISRAGAKPGDDIWLSGNLGGAAKALQELQQNRLVSAELRNRLDRPEPRCALGLGLRGLATAMIDVSDGLLADLQHILVASDSEADIIGAQLPLHLALASAELELALSGGDDYELCFTAPPVNRSSIAQAGIVSLTAVTCIGTITSNDQPGTIRIDGVEHKASGYQHFS